MPSQGCQGRQVAELGRHPRSFFHSPASHGRYEFLAGIIYSHPELGDLSPGIPETLAQRFHPLREVSPELAVMAFQAKIKPVQGFPEFIPHRHNQFGRAAEGWAHEGRPQNRQW